MTKFAALLSPEHLRLLGAMAGLFVGLILSRQLGGVRYLGYLLVTCALGVAGHTWLTNGGSALLAPAVEGVSAGRRAADEAKMEAFFRPMEAGEWRSFRGQNGQTIQGRLIRVSKDGVEVEREDGKVFRGSPAVYGPEEQAHFQERRLAYLIENSLVPAYARAKMSKREILQETLDNKKQLIEAVRQNFQSLRVSRPNCTYHLPLDYKTDAERKLLPEVAELEDMLRQTF